MGEDQTVLAALSLLLFAIIGFVVALLTYVTVGDKAKRLPGGSFAAAAIFAVISANAEPLVAVAYGLVGILGWLVFVVIISHFYTHNIEVHTKQKNQILEVEKPKNRPQVVEDEGEGWFTVQFDEEGYPVDLLDKTKRGQK
jgi:hypothetical protein